MNDGLVSVILAVQDAERSVGRAVVSLLDQTCADWECLVVERASSDQTADVVRAATGRDPRFAQLDAGRASRGAAWNLGLRHAQGNKLLFLDGEDRLDARAIESLLRADDASDGCAVYGGVELRGGNDERLPLNHGAPGAAIDGESLLNEVPFPPHAALYPREWFDREHFREDLACFDDVEMWRRFAARGRSWRRAEAPAAIQTLRRALPATELAGSLMSAIRVVRGGARGTGGTPPKLAQNLLLAYATVCMRLAPSCCPAELAKLVTSAWADESALERALLEVRGPAIDEPAWSRTLPAFAPAQWWQRCGFYGPAPWAMRDHARACVAGAITSPERVPARLAARCAGRSDVVLLGLGKNARKIAGVLARGGQAVRGRDDGLEGPPAWALEDGVPIEMIPRDAPYDPRALHVMTVLDDGSYLRRLPEGLEIVRWNEAIADIERERTEWLAAWPAA